MKNKNKKAIIHLLPLVLVGVLIAAGGIFWFGKNSNEPLMTKEEEVVEEVDMSGWETYQSEGFSFSYPNDLSLDFTNNKYYEAKLSDENRVIYVVTNESNLDIVFSGFGDADYSAGQLNSLSVFAKEGWAALEDSLYVAKIAIPQGDTYVVFSVEIRGSTEEPDTKVFDQILSTFQFTP